MQNAWLINGAPHAGVAPSDRGLAYGDGLFETMAARDGSIRNFEQHWKRLSDGCHRLGFEPPGRDQVEADLDRLPRPKSPHVVKLIVTRGGGGRGYRPPDTAQPTRIIGVFPWPDYPVSRYRNGVRAIVCETRLGENPALAGLKHLCRLENVLAQREVAAAGAEEGLMRSSRGHVISGTMSNLFIVSGGSLSTPRVDRCGIAGIMRDAVLGAARASGIRVRERLISNDELAQADELFVCNSVLGIWPIRVLGDIAFGVGSITLSLMEHLDVVETDETDSISRGRRECR